jgi:hypothetical protein
MGLADIEIPFLGELNFHSLHVVGDLGSTE